MKPSKRVTLSDIAKRMGLTKVSISKALRDHPDIADETKEKVREMAAEMGYAPNRLARSLTTNRTKTLGVIIPKIAHNFFSDLIAGVYEQASIHDYEIVLCVSRENADLEKRHLKTLLSMQVDGLLVSISEETTDPAPFIDVQRQDMPLVFVDRGMPEMDVSIVTIDDYQGAYQATDYAIQKGRNRIAHLAGFSAINIGRERRMGYEDALRDNDLPVDPDWIVEGGFDEEAGYRGFTELMKHDARPDALLTVTFPVALGATDAMREIDPSLQDEIEIYSFGQHELNRFFAHPHVSIFQPAQELGKKALSVLIEEVENPGLEPRRVKLNTRIVEPGSTNGQKMSRASVTADGQS